MVTYNDLLLGLITFIFRSSAVDLNVENDDVIVCFQ